MSGAWKIAHQHYKSIRGGVKGDMIDQDLILWRKSRNRCQLFIRQELTRLAAFQSDQKNSVLFGGVFALVFVCIARISIAGAEGVDSAKIDIPK